jgi:puromycin-sensitive aminopeptidase
MASEADYRLPRTVVPSHYDIMLEPDLDEARFEGTVDIDVSVAEETSQVVLNAIELEIHSASISQSGVEQSAVITLDEEAQRATFTVESALQPGPAHVSVAFTGILNDDLRGFYRSVYTDASGVEKTIATTQFEAADARRAFPCWDEPDLKATFATTLIVEDGLMAVTNGAETSRRVLPSGKIEVSHAKTMIMSTYLVAFIVGELVATDALDVDGTPLRIIAPPGNEHLTDFAMEWGANSLRYFAEYYDIPYPGDKLDMVAVPDFAFGAMENLGCITYRETALLVDPSTATQVEMTRVADVIAHEIAHMWFGDLVTMKWWNGIWLNEAFATFAEMKCVDAYRPEWKRWLSFSAMRDGSQETDALASTRPVEFEVASPTEANAMFDSITYQKGSSIVRMLENYIGEEAFRAGVTLYLKRHAYGNTDTPDLWAALEETSGEPVGEIMDTWIFQGGYPRLSVERDGSNFRLSQEQFRLIGEGDSTWKVPVLYSSAEGAGKIVLGDEPAVISAAEDLVVDAGGEGFFRVNYEGDLLDGVVGRLGGLEPIERYSVVSDAFANVLKGDVDAASYLALVSTLSDEDEVDVWAVALAGLSELDKVTSSDDRPAMQAFVRGLVSDKADEMGWTVADGESDRDRQMRGLLLKALGNLGNDQETIATARTIYDGEGAVDAEIADAVLSIVASNADADRFDHFIERSRTARSPQQTVKYLRAATQIADPDTAEQMFHMALNGEVRAQDSFWVFALLLGHRDNGPRIWQLMMDNWDAVLDVVPPVVKRRILDLVPNRSEPDVAASIFAWFDEHSIPGGEAAVHQKLEVLRANVGLRSRETGRLGEALKQVSES